MDYAIHHTDLRTIRVSFGCEASIYKFFFESNNEEKEPITLL